MNTRDAGRILVVDDLEDNREILRRMLERGGHEVLLAADGDEAIQRAIREQPDVVILDVGMPGKDGFEVCRELRALAETASIPVVFLTANFGEEADRLLGLELGGFDYLVKPVTRPFLLARMAVMVRIRRSEQEIRRLAMIDALTGLYTRGYVLHRLDEEIDRAGRQPSDIAVTMIDLDGFKGYNDRHGHLFGDRVLRLVADSFRQSVRRHDAVGRFGGDEFVLFQSGTSVEEAELTIERMREALLAIPVGDGDELPVTFSAGIAVWEPALDGETVLGRADAALYVAKGAGKGRTQRWLPQRADPSQSTIRTIARCAGV